MLASARSRRNQARRREQHEFDKAEREIMHFALAWCDTEDPTCITGETRRWFDWGAVRRAVAETQFWDACYTRAEEALTNCLSALKGTRE